jgi:hypothetical protein
MGPKLDLVTRLWPQGLGLKKVVYSWVSLSNLNGGYMVL